MHSGLLSREDGTMRVLLTTWRFVLAGLLACGAESAPPETTVEPPASAAVDLKDFWNSCLDAQVERLRDSGEIEGIADVEQWRIEETRIDRVRDKLCDYCRQTVGWGEAVDGNPCINDLKSDCGEFRSRESCP